MTFCSCLRVDTYLLHFCGSSSWKFFFGVARDETRSLALALSAPVLIGLIGSWFPQVNRGLKKRKEMEKILKKSNRNLVLNCLFTMIYACKESRNFIRSVQNMRYCYWLSSFYSKSKQVDFNIRKIKSKKSKKYYEKNFLNLTENWLITLLKTTLKKWDHLNNSLNSCPNCFRHFW